MGNLNLEESIKYYKEGIADCLSSIHDAIQDNNQYPHKFNDEEFEVVSNCLLGTLGILNDNLVNHIIPRDVVTSTEMMQRISHVIVNLQNYSNQIELLISTSKRSNTLTLYKQEIDLALRYTIEFERRAKLEKNELLLVKNGMPIEIDKLTILDIPKIFSRITLKSWLILVPVISVVFATPSALYWQARSDIEKLKLTNEQRSNEIGKNEKEILNLKASIIQLQSKLNLTSDSLNTLEKKKLANKRCS